MADAATDDTSLPRPPAPARKRQASRQEGGSERVIKHRSSKACQSCRTRKVRCDVSAKGSRCTNCQLDHLNCVVLPSRRGQTGRHRRDSIAAVTQARSHHEAAGVATVKALTDGPKTPTEGESSRETEGTNHVPAVVTFDEENESAASGQQHDETHLPGDAVGQASPNAYEVLLTPETAKTTMTQIQSPAGMVSLPAFIAPLPTRMLSEDLDFLARKGAFAIPDRDMCLEILRAYLFSVQPFMPMLDVRLFTRAILQEDRQISLLLFHSVMFAGLHSLPSDVVLRLGYASAKQAREAFMDRARLLYDFNVEADSAAILQSLILMSSWYSRDSPWNERRHTWHWTGLAYDMARTMGVHREPAARLASTEARRFRRRLWWSLYIRDRMIALGTRRPMRIQDDEFDVSMLALEDFDLDPIEATGVAGQVTTLGLSLEENTAVALMCIELAKLCMTIGRVVSSQYTTLGTRAGASHNMMVMPRRDGDHAKDIESCDSELHKWFDALPINVRRNRTVPAHNDSHRCAEVQWAQLNMTYFTVVNVLYRAQALQTHTNGQALKTQSRSRVKDAARSITKLGQTMLQNDQVRFLSLIGVTALLAACLTHMLDVGSSDEDMRDASTFRLCQSLQILESLRSVYASADSAVTFLASVTRKAGIQLPMQTGNTADFAFDSPKRLGRSGSLYSEPRGPDGFPLASQRNAQGLVHDAHFSSDPMDDYRQSRLQADERRQRTSAANLMPLPVGVGMDPNSVGTHATCGAPISKRGSFGCANGDSNAERDTSQLLDANSGGYPNLVAEGLLSEWNNGMDAGMGLGSMSFNYDFFSDAFGFLDADLQGL